MKKKMSKFNIAAKMGVYLIVLIMGSFIGYLLQGEVIPIAALCIGTSFLISVIEEDLMTR